MQMSQVNTMACKKHVLSKVVKNIIFQIKTLLVMFYRHNKIFSCEEFCMGFISSNSNPTHENASALQSREKILFLKTKHKTLLENSEDSLAS